MKKYILALVLILASPFLLVALPQETWRGYEGDEVAEIKLSESWKVISRGGKKLAAFTPSSQPNLFGMLGMIYSMQENLSAYNADLDLSLEYISLWNPYTRLKHLSIEDCEHITQLLNEERFLKVKPQGEESLHSIKLIKKEFLNMGGRFPVLTYELSTNIDFFKIRYVITLHQDKKQQDKILVLRFLYSSPETSEEEEASVVALTDIIASKWEITPPGPYIEVPFVAITIISAYLLAWSGLLIKRFCQRGKRNSHTSSYPRWLLHLKTLKGRLAYCPMFLLPFLCGAGRYFSPSEFLIVSAVALITGIVVLSILHLVACEWKPWEYRGKPFRVTVFMMGLWVIAVFAFALIVGPVRFDPEETEESSVIVANILLWALLPTAMGGTVSYIYQKYIK